MKTNSLSLLLFATCTRCGQAKKHVRPTKNDFLVTDLVDIEPVFDAFQGEMYAGLLPIDPFDDKIQPSDDAGHLMFWYFHAEERIVEDSLVIWFNGGPGCSSFSAGLSFEIGPVTSPLRPAGYFGGFAEAGLPYVPNEYAWSNVSDIMFVEQPVGVGYSYGGTPPQNETDVSRDFYGFLQNFFTVFPGMRQKRLFLVGESYAGMYVPSIAHYIYLENKKLEKSDISEDYINIAGIGIGNGLIDVTIQGPVVIDYAWWHGMIDSVTRDALHEAWQNCYNPAEDFWTKEQPDPFHTFTVIDDCGMVSAVMEAAGEGVFPYMAPNIYDVTTWDPYAAFIADNATTSNFFNDPRVQKALHAPVNKKQWRGCLSDDRRRRLTGEDRPPNKRRLQGFLQNDRPVTVAPYIADLLDNTKVSVLVYNGDRDIIVCAQGSEMVLNDMDWGGSEEWLNPDKYKRGVWVVDGYPAGYSKTVRNLNFVVVYNSGHMVPTNVPAAGFDLITRLLQGDSFVDNTIPIVYRASGSDMSRSATLEDNLRSRSGKGQVWLILAFVAGIAVSQLISRVTTGRRSDYEPIVEVK